jgi:alginate O-acetyltransferase complex protein AlgI
MPLLLPIFNSYTVIILISIVKFPPRYIYVPLGGNKSGHTRNIAAVFLFTAMWHGAELNFLGWGFANILLLCFEDVIGG